VGGGGSSAAAGTPVVGNGTDAKSVELRDVLAQLRKELGECLISAGQLIKSQTKASHSYCLGVNPGRVGVTTPRFLNGVVESP